MPSEQNQVTMEGVRIIFRNFAGKEGKYNAAGQRNFAVILPSQEIADQMLADGWNVKYLQPREDHEEEEMPTPYLKINVKYGKGRPPRAVVVTDRNRTNLDEDTIETLDLVDIKNVDLIVRPYEYDVNGKQGISAYLKSIYVTIEEDELEKKYGELDAQ